MDLRERIEAVLAKRPDLNPRSASLRAGFSDSWLHKLLNGGVRSPTLDSIEKLAEVLDVDPRWLAYGEGDPERFPDVGELLARMSEETRAQAVRILQVMARTGTDG